MTYLDQANLAAHAETQLRMIACAARQGIQNPSGWVSGRAWELTAYEGMAEAFGAAEAASAPVSQFVTDELLLAAVLSVRSAESNSPGPAE